MKEIMGDPFEPFLKRSGVVILDGAMATELERRGADLNDHLWSAKVLLEVPELIREVHLDYFLAGADVATTASYQATFEGFARLGLSRPEATRLMQLSVRLASEARDQFWAEKKNQRERTRPLIAASIGSYGAFLADGSEYRGDYTISSDQLIDFHRKRIEVLLQANPDLLAFETVPCLSEGKALIGLLSEFPQAQAWLSFSCCDGEHVCHGEAFRDCVESASLSQQIVAVGLNCTLPEFVEPLICSAAGVTDKHLIVYPNSGEGWDAQARRWTRGRQRREWGEMAGRWYEAGVRLIGGCCRTTPAEVSSVASAFGRTP